MDDESVDGIATTCQGPLEEGAQSRKAGRAAYGIQDVPECFHAFAVPDYSDGPTDYISFAVVEHVATCVPASSGFGAVSVAMLIGGKWCRGTDAPIRVGHYILWKENGMKKRTTRSEAIRPPPADGGPPRRENRRRADVLSIRSSLV